MTSPYINSNSLYNDLRRALRHVPILTNVEQRKAAYLLVIMEQCDADFVRQEAIKRMEERNAKTDTQRHLAMDTVENTQTERFPYRRQART